MVVTSINILGGEVVPYVTPFVTGNDPVDLSDQSIDFSGWDQLTAGTDSGATFNINAEWHEVVVQEHRAAIEARIIKEGGTVTFDTQETDLLSISEVLAPSTYVSLDDGSSPPGVAGTNPNTLSGGDKVTVANQSLAFTGDGPVNVNGVGQIWFFPHVHFETMEDVTASKDSERMFRITWKLLMDPARDAGERLWKVFEITSA